MDFFILFIAPWLVFIGLIAGPPPEPVVPDAEAGRNQFRRCMPCHEIEQPLNKLGPHMAGVFGRPAGALENFNYSIAMKQAAAAGLVWDEANLAAYLRSPRELMPGTSMNMAGMRNEQDLADLIAYLKTVPKP